MLNSNILKKGFLLIALTYFFTTLTSCSNNTVVGDVIDFKNAKWPISEKPSFNFAVADTVSTHNFYITLRNNNDYPYRNFILFLRTDFPNEKYSVDTLECTLAKPDGTWLGKGFGTVKSHKILYAQGKRFPLAGNYTISFEHAMRQDTLNGLLSAGIIIEPTRKK
jgi:gliding motility-associated lipoprotein GldH